MSTLWKQHNHNISQLQEKLAEREARILALQRESRAKRSWVPESRMINTASQREIMELKKELKELYKRLEVQQPVEKKQDDNVDIRSELQKMQQELAHMHTLVKKQRNALLLAQVSPRKTRSSKKKKPLSPIAEEPEPPMHTPAPSPAPAAPAVKAISEEVPDTQEEEEQQPQPEQQSTASCDTPETPHKDT